MEVLHVLLFMPFEGEVSFESIKTKKDAVDFVNTYFPNVEWNWET